MLALFKYLRKNSACGNMGEDGAQRRLEVSLELREKACGVFVKKALFWIYKVKSKFWRQCGKALEINTQGTSIYHLVFNANH